MTNMRLAFVNAMQNQGALATEKQPNDLTIFSIFVQVFIQFNMHIYGFRPRLQATC